MKRSLTIFLVLLIISGIKSQTNLNTAKIIQFGSIGNDEATCVTADNTGIYVGGVTDTLFGSQHFGKKDCFIRKYSLNGDTLLWTVQFGAPSLTASPTQLLDDLTGIAVNDSGLFVVGKQNSNPWPGPNPEKGDGFLKRFSKSGTLIWTSLIASPSFGDKTDEVLGITLDNNGIYICGGSGGDLYMSNYGNEDAMVAKFNYKGVKIWGKQFGGVKFEEAFNLSVYQNKLYVIGTTGSALGVFKGQTDAFVTCYDTSGVVQWLKQLGTDSTEFGKSIAVDANGIHCVGYTEGPFCGSMLGYNDGYTMKLDHLGNLGWGHQFGTNTGDVSNFVVSDPTGIYTTGLYKGSWKHGPFVSTEEVYIKKYAHTSTATVIWETVLNSPTSDIGTAIYVDNTNVYSVGYTKGNLSGINAGGNDAFLAIMNKTSGVNSVNENSLGRLDFSVYPNPTKEKLTIRIDDEESKNIRIELINAYGQIITPTINKIGNQYLTLAVSKLEDGIYFINIESDKGRAVQKIVISK